MTEPSSFFSQYCERTDINLWSEPLNAITNLAFIIAGIMIWRYYRQQPPATIRSGIEIYLLIFLLICIGIGSGLWHTVALPWTELADVIPILLYIGLYILAFFWRFTRLGWITILVIFTLFQIVNNSVILFAPRDILNGSFFYVPTFIMLIGFSYYLFNKQHKHSSYFLITVCLFTVSLTFRTLDQYLCDSISTGTHFVWHILNAIVLYRVLKVLIDECRLTQTSK